MKTEQKIINDLSEIRQMMERSTRFLSLTGLSGILAGVYALVGAYVAYQKFYADLDVYENTSSGSGVALPIVTLGLIILFLAIGTAVLLSYKRSKSKNEVLWNSAARRLAINMAIPLLAGGIFILILMAKGIFAFVAPLTLLFYGLALINASKFTFDEVRYLGVLEIILGLLGAYFLHFGLLFWTLGFGVLHILYGIYMHWRYEK